MAANPKYEENMLRRAATACRNLQKQATGNVSWFDWVPQYLENRADEEAPDSGRNEEAR